MLTIGQMARIFHVSTKTLRHYDSIGLFSPLKIGEDNQYRYYAPEQVHILKKILFLRNLGVGLEVIRELHLGGALSDPNRISSILREHAEMIRSEIKRQQSLLAYVEEMTNKIIQTGGGARPEAGGRAGG